MIPASLAPRSVAATTVPRRSDRPRKRSGSSAAPRRGAAHDAGDRLRRERVAAESAVPVDRSERRPGADRRGASPPVPGIDRAQLGGGAERDEDGTVADLDAQPARHATHLARLEADELPGAEPGAVPEEQHRPVACPGERRGQRPRHGAQVRDAERCRGRRLLALTPLGPGHGQANRRRPRRRRLPVVDVLARARPRGGAARSRPRGAPRDARRSGRRWPGLRGERSRRGSRTTTRTRPSRCGRRARWRRRGPW